MGWLTQFDAATYTDQAVVDTIAAAPLGDGFDIRTARALMWISQLAYEASDPAKVKAVARTWGFDAADAHGADGALGLIALRRGDTTILAARGTDPEQGGDILCDLAAGHVVPADPAWGGGAHTGFSSRASEAWGSCKARGLLPAPGVDHRLFATGHSLGGAIATLLARRLELSGRTVSGLCVFGCPRVFDASASHAFDATPLAGRTWRFRHDIDAVPTFPPAFWLPERYRHVGHAIEGIDTVRPLAPSDAGDGAPSLSLPGFADLLATLRGLIRAARGPKDRVARDAMIAQWPAEIRDHVPDGYLRMLGTPVPG